MVGAHFGIYLGNSTCSVAVNRENKVDVVANDGGDRVTPAVVCVMDEEVLTGLAAKQCIVRNGQRTIVGVLKAISVKDEAEYKHNNATCQPNWDEDNDVSYSVGTDTGVKKLQGVNILRHVFIQIKDITSRHDSSKQSSACICLPAWVSRKAVNIVRDAAKQAGFKVLSIVLQPTAASLAYDLLSDKNTNCLAVTLHLGETSNVGGLLEVSGGVCTVRDTISSTMRPGCTLTNKLVEYLAKEFYQKYKGDPLENKRSRQKLYNQAENIKHVLSSRSTAMVNVESLWEGVDFATQVSRARFEGLISSVLSELLQPTIEMLEKQEIETSQINKVILSGGTCKIPRLQRLISEIFRNAEVISSIPSDEVLAYGAAIEAGHITFNYGGNGNGNAVTNGDAVNGDKDGSAKKKKNVEKRKETIRSHMPVLVSAVSVNVWVKINAQPSVCVLPRLTPPHLRKTVLIPVTKGDDSTVTLTVYESAAACDNGEVVTPEVILAEIKIPVTDETKELSMTCLLKPDGSLTFSLLDSATKFNKKFSLSSVEEIDSS